MNKSKEQRCRKEGARRKDKKAKENNMGQE
jgi:hypothetical protein